VVIVTTEIELTERSESGGYFTVEEKVIAVWRAMGVTSINKCAASNPVYIGTVHPTPFLYCNFICVYLR
jgi:hypothetical protein